MVFAGFGRTSGYNLPGAHFVGFQASFFTFGVSAAYYKMGTRQVSMEGRFLYSNGI